MHHFNVVLLGVLSKAPGSPDRRKNLSIQNKTLTLRPFSKEASQKCYAARFSLFLNSDRLKRFGRGLKEIGAQLGAPAICE